MPNIVGQILRLFALVETFAERDEQRAVGSEQQSRAKMALPWNSGRRLENDLQAGQGVFLEFPTADFRPDPAVAELT